MLPGAKENVSLAEYSSFEIGGSARYFFVVKKKEDLLKILNYAKEKKLPYLIIGEGTNLLFPDKGYEGVVIKIETDALEKEGEKLNSGAGTSLISVVSLSLKNSLTGLEWAVGIPGTLGGAIYGNAQAFGKRMGDIIESVTVLDTNTLEFKSLDKEECLFETKSSIFKKQKYLIIVSAVLKLQQGDSKKSREEIKRYAEYRKQKHPLYLPSAGSVFVNYEGQIKDPEIISQFQELEEFNQKGVIPSAYLIEKCGLKGKRIGGAKFSDQHANFIVNIGEAKAKDVVRLVELAKEKVKNKFGINLKEEIQIIKQ